MAEPTEAEQQKQTQLLEKAEKVGVQSKDELATITKLLKEENVVAKQRYDSDQEHKSDTKNKTAQDINLQEKILDFTKKIDKKAEDLAKKEAIESEKKKAEREKAAAVKDKELNFGIKQEGFFAKFSGWTEEFAANVKDKDFTDKTRFKYEGNLFTRMGKSLNMIKLGVDEAQRHGEFMEGMEKKKWNLQKTMYNMSVRAAKLALRGGKAVKDWGVKGLTMMKDKAFSWIKSLGKLLILLGIWGAALWLDANMLKEDWEKLKVKLTAWKDKLVEWWGKLDGALNTVTLWWGKIKTWFEDVFGHELELWHIALAAFGLWLIGPKLAFMATFAIAKAGFWALKTVLQKMGIWPKDLPKVVDVETDAKNAKKKAKGKASWWKRMFGIADDATKKLPVVDPKTGKKFATETGRVKNLWGQWGDNVAGHADELDNLNKNIADNPNTKKGFFKTLGAKFKTMFSTVGDWAGSIGDKVGGWFKSAKTSVGGWFKGAMDTAKGLGSSIMEKGSKIVKGVGDLVKGTGKAIANIPGIKTAGKFLGGTAKTLAKVLAPLEAIRGTWAGFAKQGPDDERNLNQRMDDASAGMVKGLSDFFVTDLLDLGGLIESKLRGKDEGDTFLGGLADKTQEWSDKTFGSWKEGTQLFDAAGNPLALRLDPPEWKKKRREADAQKADLLSMTKALGLTEETTVKAGRGGARKSLAFDKEGFQRLLLAASNDQSFAMMQQMVAGLAKAGKLSAEDAERYKMDISKEQAAGTAPVIITNNNSTSNSGSTTMIAASNASNPMNQILKDW